MGIRYEKGHKATNGPMFFFSILRDEVFEEEIRNAVISGLSFYAYRFPGDSMMCYGSSEGYLEGIGEPGFVIGRFSPDLPVLTIPYKGEGAGARQEQNLKSENKESIYQQPSESTGYEDYSNEVERIVKALKDGKGEKVVATRVIVRDKVLDIADKFYELCQRFPEAFVFCFSTPVTGCWIGASPELLLEGKEGVLHTMALAGTRPADTPGPWDDKNIREQRIVKDYISEIFENNGINVEPVSTYTKKTGNLEHICTPIKSKSAESVKPDELQRILSELSPTPALCGYPKDFALKMIKESENFDRGCYGGFCGPYHSPGDFTFHVVIRCASVSEKRYCVYAGGGITSQSDVASEWDETEMKLQNTFEE